IILSVVLSVFIIAVLACAIAKFHSRCSQRSKTDDTRTTFDDAFEVPRKLIYVDFNFPLGKGTQGSVFLGSLNTDAHADSASSDETKSRRVAIKMNNAADDHHAQKSLLKEIHVMKCITSHPNINKLVASVTIDSPILLVVEYCKHGSLLDYLKAKYRSRLRNSLNLVCEVIEIWSTDRRWNESFTRIGINSSRYFVAEHSSS
ncbi:hypothetical protein PMAYCL1PPCAC_10612, partial [Pristionchus mayeri]